VIDSARAARILLIMSFLLCRVPARLTASFQVSRLDVRASRGGKFG
jgi:hypothetical protein